MITKIRKKKETGFSLLELSVAVGVAAIVASAGIVATTTFIGSAQDKRDNYTANADSAIEAAESSSIALGLTPIVAASNTATSSVGTDSATITWDAPANPVGSFTILVDGELVDEVSSSATSYTLTGLDAGTTYNVIVRSVGSNGTADAQISVETAAPQTGIVEAIALDGSTNVATFTIDGSTYTAYNEGAASWSSSEPVLSVALPLNNNGEYSGALGADGYFMWEAASKDPQNHYGYWFDSSTQIVPTETGALIFLNNDEVFQGFSVMFDGDPFNGGQIVNNTEWASQYQASGVNSFGMPTQDWFMNAGAYGSNYMMGGSGPWTGSTGGCLYCGIGEDAVDVGGLTGWAVKIGDNGAWLPFDIAEMADGVVFPGDNWDFLDYLNQTHGVTEIQQGEKVQLRTPNGAYSNIYVSDTPLTLGN